MPQTELHSPTDPNRRVSDHFLYSDFVCPCCDRLKLIPAFFRHVSLLEDLRHTCGFPLIVTSGYRCPEHNRAIGGATSSWHLLFATDIRPERQDPEKLRTLYKASLAAGFGGIGLYDTFIHLDLRPEPVRWRG
jgi:uncharacterized protein YcbK (DUF882 family)